MGIEIADNIALKIIECIEWYNDIRNATLSGYQSLFVAAHCYPNNFICLKTMWSIYCVYNYDVGESNNGKY